MKIVEARNKDYDALKELFLKERQRTFLWLDTSEFQLDDFEKSTRGEYILTALIDDIPVGFISIWMPTRFIHHLYIDKNHQGKKVGTALIKAAIAATQLPLTLKCLENNLVAIEFYKHKGFVEKEKGQSSNGAFILFELSKDIS